jgi:Tol biopolymer transport system component
MAFVRETEDQSFLMVANVDGSGVRQLAARKFPAGFELSAWSPSGETIASFGYNSEKGIDSGIPIEITLKDGKERPITSRHWYSFWGIQWISDGTGLIAMTQEQNAAPSHLSYLSRESGQATRLTNELDNFIGASLTADSRTLATVKRNTLDDLWVGSLREQDSIKPITFGGRAEDPGWSSEGQILYLQPLEVGDEIRTVASDGSNSKRLAVNNAGRDFHLRICRAARKIVFASERSGQDHVWTMDLDGQNPKQLTNSPYDVNGFPDCSADGKWVFYSKSGPEKGIWKIPMEGGDSVRLTDQHATVPVVSPDGKMIAYYFQNEPGNPSKGLAIMSSEGGPPLRKFPVYFQYARLRWLPDSKSLLLIRGQKGVSNLWQQPINGDPPRQVTHFNADQTFSFDLSPDGKQVVMQRGRNTRDVVLIGDVQ